MILTSGFFRAFRFFLADGLDSSKFAALAGAAVPVERDDPLPFMVVDFLGRPT